jgi:hypothetical protein
MAAKDPAVQRNRPALVPAQNWPSAELCMALLLRFMAAEFALKGRKRSAS